MAKVREQIEVDFLSECQDDYVGLWTLIWLVKNLSEEVEPLRVRALTINILSGLLRRGLLRAGMPNPKGHFDEWRASADEIIERIEREWDQLDREPDIGEIVWFTDRKR